MPARPPAREPRASGYGIASNPATSVARLRPRPSNIRKIAEKTSGIRAPPQKPCSTRAGINGLKTVGCGAGQTGSSETADAGEKGTARRHHARQPAGQRDGDDLCYQI